MGSNKAKSFPFIVGQSLEQNLKLESKVSFLSKQEIIIKSVLQAMPTYFMGIFKLPKGILKKINGLYWKFWWYFNDKASKIPCIEWSKLGISMKDGGLGFQNVESFNLVFLSKHRWRIIQHPSSMISQLLK